MKFRRKPTKIYDVDALNEGKMYFGEYCGVPGELIIKYDDGSEYNVRVDDYVYLTDDDGLIHSMSSKIFEKAFERVND